jgi:glyoxylase-like metal-dependent hydrolase (beta-lactamase superfamily II)
VSEHEVLAVRYGTRTTTRAESYLNWSVYGEPDETFRMDYFFWVVRGGARTTVVDCGFDPVVGKRRGREVLVDPVEALAALGVDAARVERLVVSHAHYDHIGNLDRFPAAEVVMTARELDFWTGPYTGRLQFAHPTEIDEIADLARAHADGRVTTFSGSCELGEGFSLVEVGGHTPGQLIAQVGIPGGEAVLATDALHFYDELTDDRPFFVVADLEAMYAGFDTLRTLAEAPHRVLVAGHDADVGRRFPGREQGTGIDDLVIRIDAGAGEPR